jgi:hypothetical protein
MRRRPCVIHLARLHVPKRVGTLAATSNIMWSQHLRLAYEILRNELKLAAPIARDLVIASVSPAHACGQAVDQRARMRNEYKIRIKVSKSLVHLTNCATRAPASVRNSLDNKIPTLIPPVVDSEVIDEVLEEAAKIFASSDHEAAQTALRALSVSNLDGEQIVGLKIDYSGLGPASRHNCESALSSLASGNASYVFKVLASAIDTGPPDGVRADVSDLIVTYVAAVATLWRQNGLRPSRATDSTNTKYKSRFHRFVDLVLTAMTEPLSNRHIICNMDRIARRTWANHAQLAPETRSGVGCGLRRRDMEWLVSEDHIRKAIRLPAQKMGRDTP